MTRHENEMSKNINAAPSFERPVPTGYPPGMEKEQFTWTVENFSGILGQARAGIRRAVYGESFTTAEGYRVGACLYPNGDGMAKGRYISVFFIIMKGDSDDDLDWPFTRKVTLTLENQAGLGDIRDAFYPDPASNSFTQPQKERNVPSGCPLFCPLETLLDTESGFIKNDAIKVKISLV